MSTLRMSVRSAQCRHGNFIYHSEDRFLGTSLRIYGEWSEDEVLVYDDFLKSTDVAIEVGANIGALTIPLSRRCKQVFAFEPQPQSYELLRLNLENNGIINVDIFSFAVGAKDDVVNIQTLKEIDIAHGVIGDYGGAEVGSGSCMVHQCCFDNMNEFDDIKIDFIKMDCEGMELDVLKGAEKLIRRDRPLLYMENESNLTQRRDSPLRHSPENSKALVGWLVDHGYRCYWHCPPLYRVDNFRKYIDNIFGNSVSTNMICFYGDIKNDWTKDEVKDLR